MDDTVCFIREDNRAMAIGFEVDANIEIVRCSMVEVLDTCSSADNRELENLVDVFG